MPLKTKHRFGLFLTPLFVAGFLTSAHALEAPVPVRSAHHGDYTRIVFDLPRLLGYKVTPAADGGATISFDIDANAAIGTIKSPLVKGIKTATGADGRLTVVIDAVPGAEIKDFRLQRRVVLDVYSKALPAAAVAPKKVTSPAPKPVAEKAPLPITPIITAESMKAAIMEMQPALDAPPAPPEPVARQSSAPQGIDVPEVVTATENEARIVVSSLQPSRLAVFERSDALWLVTDVVVNSSSLPVIEGGLAESLGEPQVLRLSNGTAYRYTMPEGLYPHVKKSGLVWQVTLSPEKPARMAPLVPNVVFDGAEKKAQLVLPFEGAGKTVTFEDPDVGDILVIVPSDDPTQAATETPRLVDVDFVPAFMGAVARPLRDGVELVPFADRVVISAPDGLTAGMTVTPLVGDDSAAESVDDAQRLFDFPNWGMGGRAEFVDNRRMLEDMVVKARALDERASLLMRLAMLHFANGLGHEALGLLELVRTENPEVERTPEFMAIRGAAKAMAGHFREALNDFSYPPIRNLPEVSLWTGYAAAASEQWRLADQSFPSTNRLLLDYPDYLAIPFTIYMAESNLRLGRAAQASKLLDTINMSSGAMLPQYVAAIDYLRGEAASQSGKDAEAEKRWRPVAKGLDRLYHTKASLALTRLLLDRGKITMKDAIDEIDSLRFAWRGDGLEVETLRTLGELKIKDGQVLSGLDDLEAAVQLGESILEDTRPTRDVMSETMYRLFIDGEAAGLPPLEALSIYNQYAKLLPRDEDGVKAAMNFADILIRVDLLDKAAALMEEQLKTPMPDAQAAAIGRRLAVVYLLNNRPQQALMAVDTALPRMVGADQEDMKLLKARALSKLNRTREATALLLPLTSTDAQRLKVDVLWRAQDWAGAAAALDTLLPPAGAALGEAETAMIMNAAVAAKLSGDGERLAALRQNYGKAMAQTPQAAIFGVVTRDGGVAGLQDRDTMLNIAGEVDLFKNFLDAYKEKPAENN